MDRQLQNPRNCCAFVVLPRAGLANRLFVWARGYVFSQSHGIPLYVHGWANVNVSPFLRRDRSFRFYYPYFFQQTNYLGYHYRRALSWFGVDRFRPEPSELSQEVEMQAKAAWVFRGIPWWEDYFVALRGYESVIREGFFRLVKPHVVELADRQMKPEISLHIRRGDFRIARDMTGNEYFIQAVQEIRKAVGEHLSVTVFSDAEDNEIADVLSLPSTVRHPRINDVSDMIVMSRSKVIVTSLHSTYGYWAGYLSDAAIILDPRHGEVRVRSPDSEHFEGTVSEFCESVPLRD